MLLSISKKGRIDMAQRPITLPALPEAHNEVEPMDIHYDVFTASQMQAYARAAVEADREAGRSAPVAPEGFWLAPVEPTKQMLRDRIDPEMAIAIYHDMRDSLRPGYSYRGASTTHASSSAVAASPDVAKMVEALSELLSLIQRNAPELSGKVVGNAKAVLAAATQARAAASEPLSVSEASEREVKPRKYLTMVYLVRPGDEAGAITGRMDWSVATWGHVPDQRDALIDLLEHNNIEVPNELR
jgi:hypothetical protein